MGRWSMVANGIVFAGTAFVLAFGFKEESTAVLSQSSPRETAALEAEVARTPDAAHVSRLAAAYLDRNQPGLALGLIDQFPEAESPELSEVRARALFGQGEALKALSVIRVLNEGCEEKATTVPCPNWVVAKGLREQAFLEEVVEAGIEDAASEPIETRRAFERSDRQVKLVALR